MKLIDSNIAIDYLRGSGSALSLLRSVVGQNDELGASEVVRFEVLAGVRDDELDLIERFFASVSWIAIDEPIARLAGLLARRFRPHHPGIEAPDYLIAATALALDAELLTTNVRHFPMIEGLRPAY